jgi:hypothetical protein
MKALNKLMSGLVVAGLISTAVITNADAQRGAHFGGGGFRGGVSIGGGGFRGGVGFRSSIGFRAGAGYRAGYFGGGYYRPGFGFGYPSIGFRFGYLPYGYYPFYWGNDLYYYYGGAFYTPADGGGYQVTVPPVGAVVPQLPEGSQSIVINGQQYFEFSGVYYTQTVDEKGKKVYVVAGRDGVLNTDGSADNNNAQVAPQVGDIVAQLPDGCRKINLNGKKYFVSPEDIYYEEFTDANNNKGYRIASIPTEEPKEQQN